ncbi:hypothetical protein E3P92_04159 [Wallemia ichthyophaga]|uniref:Uncharacterized protein n=2 Tax=Wallemia ichthyophaga TaxID=245174 RepID=A0A4T0JHK8_WALIC|nr:uncharacterized protein J056_003814 [Wallemia ichthyophaga EXF-994]TIA67956.1 hypothetical protein E3P91_04189 [Wallemia ichthyophaga]EOQ98644.1 hypothetical protein J056_003814 [Wallemia ichthyophaga EXF-994]TIA77446.1 hypothetical protein E3P98_04150 [Wallemia ichthyophaga]TIA86646.1 hypothetical protein E3P97_04144 [Wallemia ichthyophaga]TIA94628.1 hypothetical protein E3P95_04154 [Wallemia ichthyophaga]
MRHWLEGPLKKSKKKGHLTIGIANGETFSSHCEDKIFSDLNFDVFDLIIDFSSFKMCLDGLQDFNNARPL